MWKCAPWAVWRPWQRSRAATAWSVDSVPSDWALVRSCYTRGVADEAATLPSSTESARALIILNNSIGRQTEVVFYGTSANWNRNRTHDRRVNKLCGRPPRYAPPLQVGLWPFDLERGVRVTCDVGYLCANFSLPRPLYSRLRADVRDRQTSDRQTSDTHHRLMRPIGAGHNNNSNNRLLFQKQHNHTHNKYNSKLKSISRTLHKIQ